MNLMFKAGIDKSEATTLFIGTVRDLVMQSILAEDAQLMQTQAMLVIEGIDLVQHQTPC